MPVSLCILEDQLLAVRTNLGGQCGKWHSFQCVKLGWGYPEQASEERAPRQASCPLLWGWSGLSCGASTTRQGERTASGLSSSWAASPFSLRSGSRTQRSTPYPNGDGWEGHTHAFPSFVGCQCDVMCCSHSHHSMPLQNYTVANITKGKYLALSEPWLICHVESFMYLIQSWCLLRFCNDKHSLSSPLICLGLRVVLKHQGCTDSFSLYPQLARVSWMTGWL